jgi:hypothetical protein
MNSTWEFSDNPNFNVPGVGTIREIAEDWVRFLFNVPRGIHPHGHFELASGDRRRGLDDRQRGRPAPRLDVWHLLEGNFSELYNTHIPVNHHWPIMFSEYVTMATEREFPDVVVADLRTLVNQDTDRAVGLVGTINGDTLTPIRIRDGTAANVIIDGNNVFDLDPGGGPADIVFDGYFTLLKPLAPGDYLIESSGYSPGYKNDVRYHVYTRDGTI